MEEPIAWRFKPPDTIKAMNKLIIKFIDGESYEADAEQICNRIAAKEADETQDFLATFKRSRELLEDEFKLFDAINILTWEDIKDIAILASSKNLFQMWKDGSRTLKTT